MSLHLFLVLVEVVTPFLLNFTIIVSNLRIFLIDVVFYDHFKVRMLRLNNSFIV